MQPLQEDGERPAPDPLAAPDDTTTNNNNNNKDYDDYSPAHTHLKTYTAGEDKSRLQQAARELGLRQARQPRRQVRKVHDFHQNPVSIQALWNALWNSATEDARMRAVYVPPHYDAQGMLLGDYYHDNIDDDDYFFRHAPSQPDTELGPSRPPLSSSSAVNSHGEPLGGGNLTAAVLGIVKGMVGPAILYLPHGFATAGYLVALPIVMVCTLLFLYSSRCLLDAWKIEQEKVSPPQSRESDTSSSNERTALLPHHRPRQFLSYPELAYRALGPSGERTVQLGIALMQSGVCLTYLIFVPQNLHSSWLHLTNQSVAPSYWLIVMLGVQVPLSWIRDIRKFTPTNLLANGLILYGLVTCIGFALDEASQPWQPVAAVVDPAAVHDSPWANIGQHFAALQPWAADWFLFVGTSVLLFEGSITLLVPLQEAVDDEQQRAQFPAVYQRVILSIVGFYVVFGLTCWMAFGPDVQTVLTTSLPNTNLATTVQLAYSVAVLLTFPLQNFPALEIACRGIQSQVRKRTHLAVSRNVTSSVLVCLLGAVAVWTMDDLDKVVSLMGSLLGCPIAFCFPPLIHSRLDPNLSIQRLWANRIVAGLGVVAMVLASAVTLITW